MHDQANQLRRLVRDRSEADFPQRARRPRLVLLAGGKGGVGTTTVAVNLAVALARRGLRTGLVDADSRGGDVAVLCGLEERFTLADVIAQRRTLPASLQSGPGGIRVLGGDWRWKQLPGDKNVLGNRLLTQLESLDAQVDLMVLDVGNGPNDALRPIVWAADVVLAVTTAETPAVLNTYAWIKTLEADGIAGHVGTLVNQAPSATVAQSVQDRLRRACRRFLAMDLPGAGHVPADPAVGRASATGEPFVLAAPRSPAARHVDRLAQAVSTWDAKNSSQSTNRRKSRKPEKEEILIQPLAVASR
ncbi:MAG TPA: P-loop NTPase [Thermoguttaceae bacterium]|nr:P-loop NTPase [Thermoguttaceae bacterium]